MDPTIDEIENLMGNVNFGSGFDPNMNSGFSAGYLNGVDDLLQDISQTTNSLSNLENSLDGLLQGTSTAVDPVYGIGIQAYTGYDQYGNMSYEQQNYDQNNYYDPNNYDPYGTDNGMMMGGAMSGPGAGFLAQQQQQGYVGRGRGFATHDPMGRELVFQGPPCDKCGYVVIGKVLATLGKNYHPECFTCTYCSNPFPEGRFMDHENDPYCEKCYNDLMATRCFACQQPILEQAISASGKMYHAHHFVCTGCGSSLQGKEYKDGNDGYPYCLECARNNPRFVAPEAHMCSKCKQPIYGEYITIKGQKMHPEHYTCDMCGCGFTGGNCHERGGKYYCVDCFRKLMQPVCHACQKPIPGRSVTALGHVYHPEHFVCAQCHCPFPDSNFFEVENKPYCELHYKQLFAERCHKCDKAILGEVARACGKCWHPGCFVCTSCEKTFPTMQFWAWEDKPYCTKCFDNLPEKVRRKILKKVQMETKLDGYKDRAERLEKAKEAKKFAKKKAKEDAAKKAARDAARAKAAERNQSKKLAH